MSEPIEAYFKWLCAKVLDYDTRNYLPLMEILFKTEFTAFIIEDEHRIADAMELRREFISKRPRQNHVLEQLPCSIFELFIAFSDRAEFQTYIPAKDWFWEFLKNLGLDQFERISDSDVPKIEDILHTFTWRIYEPTGHGGIFPLDETNNDQRKVELWYQFNEYIIARGL